MPEATRPETLVSFDDIRQAQRRLCGIAVRTPLVRLGERELWLKPENLQPIGAFKIRGAYNKIASLEKAERARGVITYSSGNHAQAVAYAARAFGVPAVIVMPNNAPKVKQEATAALGAKIVLVGPASAERQRKAEELAAEHGYVMVPPYDDKRIIAGQGTIGFEILMDMANVELVLSPVSGGGLLSGIATAIKLSKPEVKVIGVEPELAADAQESLRTGALVEWPAEKTTRTICDGLRTQSLGARNWEHVRRYVDDIVTVSEGEVMDAVRAIAREARLIAEPSGAAATAAFLFHRDRLPQATRTVAIVSGGNIEPALLEKTLAAEV